MNFANLTPAERMKASGLIGLIVVILFFVVYTMMGSLGGGKKDAGPPPAAPDQQAGSDIPAGPIAANAGGPVSPDSAFPLADAKNHHASAENQDLYQLSDPFKPIRGKAKPSAAALSAMNGGEPPRVGISPASHTRALPTWGGARPAQFGGFPGQFGGFAPRQGNIEPEKPEPPKYLPEIQVVGVVHGQPSVATLRVEGHVITARPGDLLARGHRLVTVSDEGVVIRAHGELTSLRVGAGVNSNKQAQAEG